MSRALATRPLALRETNGIGISPAAAQENDEFDQLDAEEREEMTSSSSLRVSWRKVRAYLYAVIASR